MDLVVLTLSIEYIASADVWIYQYLEANSDFKKYYVVVTKIKVQLPPATPEENLISCLENSLETLISKDLVDSNRQRDQAQINWNNYCPHDPSL
jgi:hypothetical protein